MLVGSSSEAEPVADFFLWVCSSARAHSSTNLTTVAAVAANAMLSCGDDDLGWGREKEHNAAEVSCSAASRIREMKQVSCRRLRAQWLETGFSCCFIFLLFWCNTQSYGGGLGRNIQTNGFVGQCLANDFGPRGVNGLRWSFEEHFWSSVCWGTTRKCIYLCAVWSTGLIRTLNQTGSALIASGKNGRKNIKSAVNKNSECKY